MVTAFSAHESEKKKVAAIVRKMLYTSFPHKHSPVSTAKKERSRDPDPPPGSVHLQHALADSAGQLSRSEPTIGRAGHAHGVNPLTPPRRHLALRRPWRQEQPCPPHRGALA